MNKPMKLLAGLITLSANLSFIHSADMTAVMNNLTLANAWQSDSQQLGASIASSINILKNALQQAGLTPSQSDQINYIQNLPGVQQATGQAQLMANQGNLGSFSVAELLSAAQITSKSNWWLGFNDSKGTVNYIATIDPAKNVSTLATSRFISSHPLQSIQIVPSSDSRYQGRVFSIQANIGQQNMILQSNADGQISWQAFEPSQTPIDSQLWSSFKRQDDVHRSIHNAQGLSLSYDTTKQQFILTPPTATNKDFEWVLTWADTNSGWAAAWNAAQAINADPKDTKKIDAILQLLQPMTSLPYTSDNFITDLQELLTVCPTLAQSAAFKKSLHSWQGLVKQAANNSTNQAMQALQQQVQPQLDNTGFLQLSTFGPDGKPQYLKWAITAGNPSTIALSFVNTNSFDQQTFWQLKSSGDANYPWYLIPAGNKELTYGANGWQLADDTNKPVFFALPINWQNNSLVLQAAFAPQGTSSLINLPLTLNSTSGQITANAMGSTNLPTLIVNWSEQGSIAWTLSQFAMQPINQQNTNVLISQISSIISTLDTYSIPAQFSLINDFAVAQPAAGINLVGAIKSLIINKFPSIVSQLQANTKGLGWPNATRSHFYTKDTNGNRLFLCTVNYDKIGQALELHPQGQGANITLNSSQFCFLLDAASGNYNLFGYGADNQLYPVSRQSLNISGNGAQNVYALDTTQAITLVEDMQGPGSLLMNGKPYIFNNDPAHVFRFYGNPTSTWMRCLAVENDLAAKNGGDQGYLAPAGSAMRIYDTDYTQNTPGYLNKGGAWTTCSIGSLALASDIPLATADVPWWAQDRIIYQIHNGADDDAISATITSMQNQILNLAAGETAWPQVNDPKLTTKVTLKPGIDLNGLTTVAQYLRLVLFSQQRTQSGDQSAYLNPQATQAWLLIEAVLKANQPTTTAPTTTNDLSLSEASNKTLSGWTTNLQTIQNLLATYKYSDALTAAQALQADIAKTKAATSNALPATIINAINGALTTIISSLTSLTSLVNAVTNAGVSGMLPSAIQATLPRGSAGSTSKPLAPAIKRPTSGSTTRTSGSTTGSKPPVIIRL